MYIIFDTETTGLPQDYNAPITDTNNWPRMVQLAWQCHDASGDLIEVQSFIVKPEGFDIPFNAMKVHGITTDRAQQEGHELHFILDRFEKSLKQSRFLVGHNLEFDTKIVGCEFVRTGRDTLQLQKTTIDTKEESTDYCALLGGLGGKFKWPTLTELHQKLFGDSFSSAHNAATDVEATARCFLKLLRLGVISGEKFAIDAGLLKTFREKHPESIRPIGLNIQTIDSSVEEMKKSKISSNAQKATFLGRSFSHLHNHTSFSILCATTDVKSLVNRAVEWDMPAVGITDYGNMMGAFYFINAIQAANVKIASHNAFIEKEGFEKFPKKLIKGIIGCEVFISEHYLQKKFTKDQPDRRYTQVLLAKNKKGYHNLAKLCSHGFIDGYYSGLPRVGKDLIERNKENLIALSGDLNGEIPHTILNKGKTAAEEVFRWWNERFGEDFYVELFRHGLEEEEHVNEVLLKLAKKYNVKYIVQNNTFYLDQKDAHAHDILLCVRDGEKQATPIGRGRGFRFGFPNQEFYFKSSEQMETLFSDLPESFDYLEGLIDKVEPYQLSQKVLLPKFHIPEAFKDPMDESDGGNRGENAFLKHLTYEGAKKCYGESLTGVVKERIEFELKTIEKIGYPGYFLIVQDFTSQARAMDVSVGPGRGSVAGSVVAYCTGITDIDPIAYDLLFERFLNPDRISLPDIDIDFDDRGRDRIIEWVVNKYGSDQVAQIITYGTMAAKSAIRDTARVLELPLPETDRIAKMVPNISLKKLLSADIAFLREKLNSDDMKNVLELRKLSENKNNLEGQVLQQAQIIEGSVRNTGIHACGIIITPSDLKEYIPVAVSKDSELLVTQFDNNVVESVGLLKIDFLGLKTLTIIKDAVELAKQRQDGVKDPYQFPLDDPKTYELFQRGETVAIFQYESVGMQKYLRQLQPDKLDDLIAMNALYRPGPLQYIPNFIARKHGRESITYDLPEMEEFLKNTYGITVYQEQVMLLAQKLAGFSKGDADVLRKAIGKKQKYVLDKMKNQFLEGSMQNGYPQKILEKIWQDWEAFASYAFNKSHSTCYTHIAFQTAYLKAHYPAEYMAAVLSNNMHNIKEVTFFMEECRRMGVPVLGSDINESDHTFTVNTHGAIRFGMVAIKGVGEAAAEAIIREREQNGRYTSVFDLVKRVDLRTANKKTLENLALSGAFDGFIDIHRAQYFHEEHGINTLEKIIRFGSKYQETKKQAQTSLFGDSIEIEVLEPVLPPCEPWPAISKLSKEKEVVGIYITSHPLDDYRYEIKYFTNISLDQLNQNEQKLIGRELNICGIVSKSGDKTSAKSGKRYGIFSLEDYQGIREFRLFGEEYLKYEHLLSPNTFLHLKIAIDRWRDGKIRIQILQIQLLEDVLKNFSKSLNLQIDLSELNETTINQLEKAVTRQVGNKKFNTLLYDKEHKIQLSLPSKKYLIDIDKELLKNLEGIPGLAFQLE
ncbi:MAG: DNA polymerase III subunit alpha [Flavobacteriales bacterium AspAUS03]